MLSPKRSIGWRVSLIAPRPTSPAQSAPSGTQARLVWTSTALSSSQNSASPRATTKRPSTPSMATKFARPGALATTKNRAPLTKSRSGLGRRTTAIMSSEPTDRQKYAQESEQVHYVCIRAITPIGRARLGWAGHSQTARNKQIIDVLAFGKNFPLKRS